MKLHVILYWRLLQDGFAWTHIANVAALREQGGGETGDTFLGPPPNCQTALSAALTALTLYTMLACSECCVPSRLESWRIDGSVYIIICQFICCQMIWRHWINVNIYGCSNTCKSAHPPLWVTCKCSLHGWTTSIHTLIQTFTSSLHLAPFFQLHTNTHPQNTLLHFAI